MLNIKIVSWSLGIFAATSFILCVLYGAVVPESFHSKQFLEMALPAFKWLSFPSFVYGLVQSFLYGAFAGLLFVPIYNFFLLRWGALSINKPSETFVKKAG